VDYDRIDPAACGGAHSNVRRSTRRRHANAVQFGDAYLAVGTDSAPSGAPCVGGYLRGALDA